MANQCDLRPCCTLSSQILNISIDRDSITSLVPILNPIAMTLKKKSGLKSLVPVIRCPFLPLYTPGKRMHQSSLHPTTGEIFQDSSKICLFFSSFEGWSSPVLSSYVTCVPAPWWASQLPAVLLQPVNVFLTLESAQLETVVQLRYNQCQIKGNNRLLRPTGYTLKVNLLMWLAFCKGTPTYLEKICCS